MTLGKNFSFLTLLFFNNLTKANFIQKGNFRLPCTFRSYRVWRAALRFEQLDNSRENSRVMSCVLKPYRADRSRL